MTLMMEAVRTSEVSVDSFETAWCNIPEDSHLETFHWKKWTSALEADKLFALSDVTVNC
jgi:hypothetical protein